MATPAPQPVTDFPESLRADRRSVVEHIAAGNEDISWFPVFGHGE